MKCIINNQETNMKVTSVVLESDLEHPDVFNRFCCNKCGKTIVQYSAHVVMIVPGGVGTKTPVVAFCSNCKSRYLFTTII